MRRMFRIVSLLVAALVGAVASSAAGPTRESGLNWETAAQIAAVDGLPAVRPRLEDWVSAANREKLDIDLVVSIDDQYQLERRMATIATFIRHWASFETSHITKRGFYDPGAPAALKSIVDARDRLDNVFVLADARRSEILDEFRLDSSPRRWLVNGGATADIRAMREAVTQLHDAIKRHPEQVLPDHAAGPRGEWHDTFVKAVREQGMHRAHETIEPIVQSMYRKAMAVPPIDEPEWSRTEEQALRDYFAAAGLWLRLEADDVLKQQAFYGFPWYVTNVLYDHHEVRQLYQATVAQRALFGAVACREARRYYDAQHDRLSAAIDRFPARPYLEMPAKWLEPARQLAPLPDMFVDDSPMGNQPLPLLAPGTLAFIPALLVGFLLGTWTRPWAARLTAA